MLFDVNLYQRDQVYRLDQRAMQQDLQPSRQLMQKAAQAVWNELQQHCPQSQQIVVLAGAGNNGGDAFALACIAKKQGIDISLYLIGDLNRQSAESAYYRDLWLTMGGDILTWSDEIAHCDVIVDGLLGIGLNKNLDAQWQSMIERINAHPATKVSIDIPSGLNADTGMPMPIAVRADLTVSFIGRKVGCWLADGPDYCGKSLFDDLGVSASVLASEIPCCTLMVDGNINLPPPRPANSHKNRFGHVVVIGGDRGMPGAVRLSAMAALRAGAGVVSVCVHPDNYSAVAGADPELMIADWHDLPKLLQRASVVVIGPGLGQSSDAKELLKQVSDCNKPLVVDADALHAEFLDSLQSQDIVITPHPGEAARLLNSSVQQIQQNRIIAIQNLTQRWPVACVLKGSGSLVSQSNQPLSLCQNGHAGLATAGSGDVLSGLIASYLGQGLTPFQAARSAVYVHALAAEHFALQQSPESLIASDLVELTGQVSASIRNCQSKIL